MKMSILDRILLLATGLLAAYQIVAGINDLDGFSITAYTVGFGVLLVAGLLLIIMGFEALDSPIVVIVSTIIPLSISSGLVWEHLPRLAAGYLAFAALGFLAVVVTRARAMPGKLPVLLLAAVHGVAGLTIFLLPFFMAGRGAMRPPFALVGVGGGLIGLGGLLLAFLKAGRPILPRELILRILPGLLLLMAACFVLGFKLG